MPSPAECTLLEDAVPLDILTEGRDLRKREEETPFQQLDAAEGSGKEKERFRDPCVATYDYIRGAFGLPPI